jgi:alkylated DNA repair dioxygenase AlkB
VRIHIYPRCEVYNGAEQLMNAMQGELFGPAAVLPEGFVYQPDFITAAEESALVAAVRELPLTEARYKAYTARRRTVSYGSSYDFDANELQPAATLAPFLTELRNRIAQWMDIPAASFEHALVSEYRPGTPLGWHRDVPEFELIVGVSLASACRMRLRPYKPGLRKPRQDVISIELEPRSAYVMREHARWGWQHSIVATESLRYSITFRTMRNTGTSPWYRRTP